MSISKFVHLSNRSQCRRSGDGDLFFLHFALGHCAATNTITSIACHWVIGLTCSFVHSAHAEDSITVHIEGDLRNQETSHLPKPRDSRLWDFQKLNRCAYHLLSPPPQFEEFQLELEKFLTKNIGLWLESVWTEDKEMSLLKGTRQALCSEKLSEIHPEQPPPRWCHTTGLSEIPCIEVKEKPPKKIQKLRKEKSSNQEHS